LKLDGNGKCKLSSMPPSTGLSIILSLTSLLYDHLYKGFLPEGNWSTYPLNKIQCGRSWTKWNSNMTTRI
jgi:hypothetical protein